MGRGDRRSGKGKTFKGSFGNRRPHRRKKGKQQAPARGAASPQRG